jgi:hypothetical protein
MGQEVVAQKSTAPLSRSSNKKHDLCHREHSLGRSDPLVIKEISSAEARRFAMTLTRVVP